MEEVSLGRTRGARKAYDGIARAAASSKWRLPFMVNFCELLLRPSFLHTPKLMMGL